MASPLRLFRTVGVRRSASAAASVFNVTLDGRVLLTPAKQQLEVPTEQLAWAIAAEWESQPKRIVPHTMPLMKLATTAVDQVETIRGTMTDSMLRCLESDGACVRSDEPEIADKERAHFEPLLRWLARDMQLALATTDTLTLEHPAGAKERAAELLGAADHWDIAALDSLTSSCKSLVLALAVRHRRIGAERACVAARVGEQHQIDEWGEVEAGHDIDAADLALRVSAASTFLRLLQR
jgi:ATP synthase F1 complex assembly factor 2